METKRNFVDEYRAYAKQNKALNQTTTGYMAVALNQWLLTHIEEILELGAYKELKDLIDYYGIPREQMIGFFDYATADQMIDWKTQEVNELASFIISTYMRTQISLVGGSGPLTFTSIPIDTIMVAHMGEFIEHFPWDEYPYPTPNQIRMMVNMYQKIDFANSENNSSGGLWEWMVQYGEHSPIPFDLIMLSMEDAFKSGNGNTIVYGMTADFLLNQPLVTVDGDDTKLCDLWDKMTSAVTLGSTYPDLLLTHYQINDFNDLYQRIYQDILYKQKGLVMEIDGIITKDANNHPTIKMNGASNRYFLLSTYQTILVNGDEKKDRLPMIQGIVL